MTILSAQTIKRLGLLDPCEVPGKDSRGNSYGMSACGYDLTLDQDLILYPGEFKLASARERFTLPNNIVGIVHDKSSLARQGIAVQNTVAEPGWRGYLTLEVSNHYTNKVFFRAGDAIAQVIFHYLDFPTIRPYDGKYQDQERGPQEMRISHKEPP